MPEDRVLTEDDLPTQLSGVLPHPVLPGAYTSTTITTKVDEVVRNLASSPNAIELGLRYKKQDGTEELQAALAVKLQGGWAVYGEAAFDLHNGNVTVEAGGRKSWG